MKKYFPSIKKTLQQYGFEEFEEGRADTYSKWLVKKALKSDGVDTCLRLDYKKYFQVITIHLGWHHEESHNFCIESLKSGWPTGFSWLSRVEVIGSPCLLLHNLSGFLEFPLGGMDVSAKRLDSNHLNDFVDKALQQSDWMDTEVDALLVRYLQDIKPFHWRSGNSVIRIAILVGLMKSLGVEVKEFNDCATKNAQLIQSDMFNLGDASDWIGFLRDTLK